MFSLYKATTVLTLLCIPGLSSLCPGCCCLHHFCFSALVFHKAENLLWWSLLLLWGGEIWNAIICYRFVSKLVCYIQINILFYSEGKFMDFSIDEYVGVLLFQSWTSHHTEQGYMWFSISCQYLIPSGVVCLAYSW